MESELIREIETIFNEMNLHYTKKDINLYIRGFINGLMMSKRINLDIKTKINSYLINRKK